MADIYEKEPKIITFEDGSIARVWRPILTEEERARRMKEVEKAAIALIKAAIDAGKGERDGNYIHIKGSNRNAG